MTDCTRFHTGVSTAAVGPAASRVMVRDAPLPIEAGTGLLVTARASRMGAPPGEVGLVA